MKQLMKLHLITPWDDNKDLGRAYNQAMQSVGSNDWVCFTDMDAMHTTTLAPLYIRKVIKDNPGYGLFTAVTNRVFNTEQVPFVEYWDNDSLHFHRQLGQNLWDVCGASVRPAKQLISGVVLLTSKKAWEMSGGFKSGILGIDNYYDQAVRDAGLKTGIMQGVYVFHYYRNGNKFDTKHLK